MHYLAPIPILLGVVGVIGGLLWIVGAGADEDGGPDKNLFFLFGLWYIAARAMKALQRDPMGVLPGFGFVVGGGALIWVGVVMI